MTNTQELTCHTYIEWMNYFSIFQIFSFLHCIVPDNVYTPQRRDFTYEPPFPLDFPKSAHRMDHPPPLWKYYHSLWIPKISYKIWVQDTKFSSLPFFSPKKLLDSVTDTSSVGMLPYIQLYENWDQSGKKISWRQPPTTWNFQSLLFGGGLSIFFCNYTLHYLKKLYMSLKHCSWKRYKI